MNVPVRFLVFLGVAVALFAGAGDALARSGKRSAQSTEAWAATVVTRIAQADLKAAGGERRGGTVTVRLRIAADGGLDGAAIESGSGSRELDDRALKAVRAAAPFQPPPSRIVTLEGYTELSFPLELDSAAR